MDFNTKPKANTRVTAWFVLVALPLKDIEKDASRQKNPLIFIHLRKEREFNA